MTFSLAGICERTGMVGIAVSSSSPAVAARCAHARAGAGAAASQNASTIAPGTASAASRLPAATAPVRPAVSTAVSWR